MVATLFVIGLATAFTALRVTPARTRAGQIVSLDRRQAVAQSALVSAVVAAGKMSSR